MKNVIVKMRKTKDTTPIRVNTRPEATLFRRKDELEGASALPLGIFPGCGITVEFWAVADVDEESVELEVDGMKTEEGVLLLVLVLDVVDG
jgi:hypothetical protein